MSLVQIGVISFDDQVNMSTAHPCYSRDLALMTPANKEKLTQFVGRVNPRTGAKANFSNALKEAYRLLPNEEQPGNKKRGMCLVAMQSLHSMLMIMMRIV